MNPMDFILLLVSAGFACLSVSIHGWTLNGLGPAALSVMGGVWQIWMQWLRHRSYLRYRDSGFAPGTQGLAFSAALGYFIGSVSSGIWLFVTLLGR